MLIISPLNELLALRMLGKLLFCPCWGPSDWCWRCLILEGCVQLFPQVVEWMCRLVPNLAYQLLHVCLWIHMLHPGGDHQNWTNTCVTAFSCYGGVPSVIIPSFVIFFIAWDWFMHNMRKQWSGTQLPILDKFMSRSYDSSKNYRWLLFLRNSVRNLMMESQKCWLPSQIQRKLVLRLKRYLTSWGTFIDNCQHTDRSYAKFNNMQSGDGHCRRL